MNRYFCKSVETYRVDTIDDVENFHDYLQDDSEEKGYFLSNFKYDYKTKKEKQEIIEEYYLITATKVFQDYREPTRQFEENIYKTKNSSIL